MIKVGTEIVADPRINAVTGEFCCMKCTRPAPPVAMEGVSLRVFRCEGCRGLWLELHPSFLPGDTHNLLAHLQQMESQAKTRCERSVKDAIARERFEKKEAAKEEAEQKAKAEAAKEEAAKREAEKKRRARREQPMAQVF
jgi:hypothetical protein